MDSFRDNALYSRTNMKKNKILFSVSEISNKKNKKEFSKGFTYSNKWKYNNDLIF